MKLLFDVGNTFLKWALYEDHISLQTGSFPIKLETLEHDLLSLYEKLQEPEQLLLSNVNSADIETIIQKSLQNTWGKSAWIAKTSATACGIKNSYSVPETLGVDRWLTMLGAKQINVNKGFCIVDCGSAITIDSVNANGSHKGGLILPGLGMMQKALTSNTAKLSYEKDDEYCLDLAENTSSAIKNGCYLAVIAAINKAYNEIVNQKHEEIDFFITGGDAELLIGQDLDSNFIHKPELIFTGLLHLYEETR